MTNDRSILEGKSTEKLHLYSYIQLRHQIFISYLDPVDYTFEKQF